jgi:hypothetical protein
LRGNAPAADEERVEDRSTNRRGRRFVLALTTFALIGLSLPLVQWIIPRRYPILTPEETVRAYAPDGLILENGETISPSDLLSFLQNEKGATVLYGRALYPSYYEKGRYWGDENPTLLAASEYDRLQFHLIGPRKTFAFIPFAAAPAEFPHATDVLIVGCESPLGIKALAIRVDGQPRALTSSEWNGLTCLQEHSKTESSSSNNPTFSSQSQIRQLLTPYFGRLYRKAFF